jgi:hypothetical protein
VPSYDTFLFKVKNANKRKQIIKYLAAKKIGTKNVPDAIKWHFATYWKHALKKSEIRSIKDSSRKIKEYIAIPILLKTKIKTYNEIGEFIKKINF